MAGTTSETSKTPKYAALNGAVYAFGTESDNRLLVGGAFDFTTADGRPAAHLAVWYPTRFYVGGLFQKGVGLATGNYLLACDLDTGAARSTVAHANDNTGGVYALTRDSAARSMATSA